MRKLSFVAAALLLLVACEPSSRVGVSEGVVADATIDSLMIVSSIGDTLEIGVVGVGSEVDELLMGDTVEVYYRGEYRDGVQADSLVLRPWQEVEDKTLGRNVTHSYTGVLPADSCLGMRYELTIRNQEHSGDGTFTLKLTYLEAENGEDRSFRYMGKRFTLRGMLDDNDATVWQCIANDGRGIFNFVVESDSSITLLNDCFERRNYINN